MITCTVVTGEVDIKSKFRDVNKELNVIDKKLIIIWATIATHSRYSSTMMGDEEVLLNDRSGKVNYLIEKLRRKFECVMRGGETIKVTLNEYNYNIEDLVESAKTSAKVTWTCEEHDFLQTLKEIKSELGALDLRLSMLRSAITTCIDLLMKGNEGKQDKKLKGKVK